MWLVIGQHNDVEARWVAAGLRARSDRPVALVTDARLVHDCRWEHRVGAAGAFSRLELGDGTVLDPDTVDGVVNRLCWLGAEAFAGASDRDRDYATGELYALGLAWLESLGDRVVNRPTGNGLCGSWRRTAEWRSLARTVGLPIVPYDTTAASADAPDRSDNVVLVLDGTVLESGPGTTPAARDGLVALQKASGLDLLEVRLACRAEGEGEAEGEREGLALRSASFLPSMSLFGDRGLDALLEALVARRRAAR